LCGERQPRSPGTSDKTILLFATSRPGECGAQNHIKRQGCGTFTSGQSATDQNTTCGRERGKDKLYTFDGETYVVHMPDPTSRFSTT